MISIRIMHTTHRSFVSDSPTKKTVEVLETQIPFDELILSWNGFRPKEGFWSFSISLYKGIWSEFIPLADWGYELQKTFSHNPFDSFAKSYQDVAIVKEGFSTGYRIQVLAKEGATLDLLQSVTVSFGRPSELTVKPLFDLPSVLLSGVHPTSQQILQHPRAKDLCSPTSTSAAINFLLKERKVNPVHFASQSRDQSFDIYGNWILNTAAAFEALNGQYHTFVARLPDFGALHAQLIKGFPVVVSVRGPLLGAPLPYANGHLILVQGYDREARRVLCMDPAYPTDEQTISSYPLEDFLTCWTERRKNLSYIFDKLVMA